jgi:transposase-like protein
MKQKVRQQHPPGFKAKVALEAVKERLSVAQIAAAYRIHPTQVGVWKKQLLEAAPLAFTRPQDHAAAAQEALAAELFAKIGRLEMELEWLQKKLQPPV